MCICDGKRSVHEGDIVSVEEVFAHVGRDVWMGRVLGVSGNIDAMEGHLPIVWVSESSSIYSEAEGSHGRRVNSLSNVTPTREAIALIRLFH